MHNYHLMIYLPQHFSRLETLNFDCLTISPTGNLIFRRDNWCFISKFNHVTQNPFCSQASDVKHLYHEKNRKCYWFLYKYFHILSCQIPVNVSVCLNFLFFQSSYQIYSDTFLPLTFTIQLMCLPIPFISTNYITSISFWL